MPARDVAARTDPAASEQTPFVDMRGIGKSFPGVVANADVDFDVRAGEVHALLGENGAGKSTLMNILTGIYQPDTGEIAIAGRPALLRKPADAIAAGIGMVHQHFKLVQAFTVAENLHLGFRDAPFFVSSAVLRRRTVEIEQRYGLKISPDAPIYRLSAGEQQRVEILKALARGARLLILDEPTAVLTDDEAQLLFEIVRRLRAEGLCVVFISHKLDEVLEISDRISVLRGGRKVATVPRAGADHQMLASLMVGRAVISIDHRRTATVPAPVISVCDLATAAERGTCGLDQLDLTLNSGEIVGVAGVAGNGQRELSEALTGLRAVTSGTITVHGSDFTNRSPRAFAQAGIGHIPEDRLRSGIAGSLSLTRNAILREYFAPPLSSGPWLKRGATRAFTEDLLKAANVAAPMPSLPIRNLSGGNQQRFIVQRETRIATRALIAAYPTRGLDIAATETVRGALVGLRNKGVAVLVISEDLDELLGLADRIVVMYEGRIIGTRAPPWNRDELGMLMGGQT
jgi:general nucleoside transport system ATP-binding protein